MGRGPGYFSRAQFEEPPLSDVFKEVDEDLRRDQLAKLWKRFGVFVIAGAVAIVAATGGYVAWKNYRTKQLMQQGDAFVQALVLSANGQTHEAAEAFAALADGTDDGIGILARFNQASILAESGEAGEAVKVYETIAATAPQKSLRDIAVLSIVALSLESVDPAESQARLEPLLAADNPFRFSARELSALVAFHAGDIAKARELFKELSEDKAAPSEIRGRAEQMLLAVG
jgi:hypothetical protein